MRIGLAHALVDLWARREEPVGHDVPSALHLAAQIETEPDAPIYIRALAWSLVDAMVRATGWSVPEAEGLVRCRSAAASTAHGTALLLEEIAAELKGDEEPVLILGALGAGMSLFGRWDVLPASGAFVVRLDGEGGGPDLPPPTPDQRGVRCCHAGPLSDSLRTHSRRVRLGDAWVRVPTAILIAARISGPPWSSGDISSFLFCAAACEAFRNHQFEHIAPLAHSLGRESVVREASVRLELEHWLDVRVPPMSKIAVRVRQLVHPALHARMF